MISSALPLLFLDVDGPLIPFGATRQQLPELPVMLWPEPSEESGAERPATLARMP